MRLRGEQAPRKKKKSAPNKAERIGQRGAPPALEFGAVSGKIQPGKGGKKQPAKKKAAALKAENAAGEAE